MSLRSALLDERGVAHVFAAPGEPLVLWPGAAPLRPDALCLPPQVHGTRVTTPEALGGAPADGLWTGPGGPAVGVRTADCVPLLLAGPDGRVAAIHAGWRGVAGGIVEGFLRRQAQDGVPMGAWAGAMGPAAGGEAYEVGPEVAVALGLPARRGPVDLRALLRERLWALGVRTVEIVGPCTISAGGSWSSYRRQGAAAARNLSAVAPAGPA